MERKTVVDSAFVQKMVTPNSKAFRDGEHQRYGYSIGQIMNINLISMG